MKIAQIILSGRYSGAEILARDLALEQKAQGFQCCIICAEPIEESFNTERTTLNRAGVEIFAPEGHQGNAFLRTLHIQKALKHSKPDVVIAHSILPSFYARACKLLGYGGKVATVLHCNSDFQDPVLKWTERTISRLNDWVIGVSSEATTEYQKIIGSRIAPVTIPNGICLQKFVFNPEKRLATRRQVLKVADSEKIVLQIGRICEQKRQLFTLDALEALAQKSPEPRLKMYFVGPSEGNNYESTFIQSINRKRNSDPTIHYLGPRPDVPELLAAADICLMPSGWEAHPIAAVEAAASGIPLIVSDIPAFASLHSYEGVQTFRRDDHNELAERIRTTLEETTSRRHERDLSGSSITECNRRYLSHLGLK